MRPRGRPKKYRVVRQNPRISQFSPRGKPGRPDEIDLTMDQFEAIRLADFQGESQRNAASSMRVSQQTFSRILRRARRLVSEALVTGKIIRIQGGQYMLTSQKTPGQRTEKNTPPELKIQVPNPGKPE